jgi:cbb3-type cytochrome oxidase cytochrome c subunit
MKGIVPLFLGIFGTFAFSWAGLILLPNYQIGHLDPQMDEEGNDPYPAPKSGLADRGRRIYAANGCVYCHSQQVRADYAASDIDRKWGERRSAPRDYLFERPVLLGKMRMGPDLANVGKRAPVEDENAPPPSSTNAASPAASPASPQAQPAPGTSPATSAAPAAAATPASSPAAKPAPATSPAPSATPANSPAAKPAPGTSPSTSATPAAKPAPGTSPASPAPATTAPPASSPATAAGPSVSPAASPANAVTTGSSPSPAPASAASAASPATNAPATADVTVGKDGAPLPYSAAWHHRHLYNPRSVTLDSNMPAYHFLYEKRRISGQRAADAVQLSEADALPEGWEVVPTYDAKCLVAYLMSLDQSHALNEVKATAAPASSPASSPAAAPASAPASGPANSPAAAPAPAPPKEAK